MMKILLINVTSKGSTGSICLTLKEEYEALGHEVHFIVGRHEKTNKAKHIYKGAYELESKTHHFFSLITSNIYGCMPLSTYRIKKLIRKINPGLIHLHCLNGYFVNIYSLTNFIKKKGYKCIYTMHADFMMSAGCGCTLDCKKWKASGCKHCPRVKQFNSKYAFNTIHRHWKRMKKAFEGFDKEKIRITGVSPWLSDRLKLSPIYKDYDIRPVLNPVSKIFGEPFGQNPYKTKNNVLFVTTSLRNPEKGGQYLDELALMMPEYNFTVIASRKDEIDVKAKNITFILGGVKADKLKDYYHYADCAILLSQRETFSMVTAEALSCGCPVVGFKAGGPESIAIPEYSRFVEYGNIVQLPSSIFEARLAKKEGIRYIACKKYDPRSISKSYVSLFSAT